MTSEKKDATQQAQIASSLNVLGLVLWNTITYPSKENVVVISRRGLSEGEVR